MSHLHLNAEEIQNLLQSEFGKSYQIGRSQTFESENHKRFILSKSKEYDNGFFWSSYDFASFSENRINYFVLAVAKYGILVLPVEIFASYAPFTSKLKSGRDNIRIQRKADKFYLVGKKPFVDVELTPYFRKLQK